VHRLLVTVAATVLVVALAPAASADHDADIHSDNMELVANWDEEGEYRAGSDLAFWGDIAVIGQFDSPGGNKMTSILLTPIPITKDNLNVVIEAGWISKDQVCQGVKAGSVPACA
jgi:D-xylose transport system substrate-binding protein